MYIIPRRVNRQDPMYVLCISKRKSETGKKIIIGRAQNFIFICIFGIKRAHISRVKRKIETNENQFCGIFIFHCLVAANSSSKTRQMAISRLCNIWGNPPCRTGWQWGVQHMLWRQSLWWYSPDRASWTMGTQTNDLNPYASDTSFVKWDYNSTFFIGCYKD